MAKPKHSDPNGRHVRVYCTLLNSNAWRVLGYSAAKLFMDLRASVMATNNGNISATLETLKHRGWKSGTTLAGALYELQAAGFLVKTRGGKVTSGCKVCALYAFTDLDVYGQPKQGIEPMAARHAYARFETLARAEREIGEEVHKFREAARAEHRAAMEKAAAKPKRGKKGTLQKLDCDAPVSGLSARFDAPVSGARQVPTIQILEQADWEANHAAARAA